MSTYLLLFISYLQFSNFAAQCLRRGLKNINETQLQQLESSTLKVIEYKKDLASPS
jgi:hypothetical protein